MTDIVVSESVEFVDLEEHLLANRVESDGAASAAFNDGVGGSTLHITLSETAGASSSAIAVRFQELEIESDAAASAALTWHQDIYSRQQVNATSLFTGSGKNVITIAESAGVSAALLRKIGATHGETANASAASPMRLTAIMRDTADSSAAETNLRFVTATLVSNANVTEAPSRADLDTENETADVTETVVGIRRVIMEIVESLDAANTDASNNHATMALVDHAAAVAVPDYHLLATQFVESGADVSEFVRLPAASNPIFWSNTKTVAGARWDGMPFNSMIFVDGAFYAAGADGLFVLADGANDVDTPIDSEVVWDLDNFGSPQRKRLHGVYVDASAKGPFTVTVTCDQGKFPYKTDSPRNATPRNYRVQPGKGLRAVYYRIGLSSSSDFGANVSEVEYEDLGRRI